MAYADVIFVISYGFEDQLKEIADSNPGKIFVNIDTVVENTNGTITSVDFIEEESAYSTGVVAGMTTLETALPGINPEKMIGAVGGDVDPVINAFIFAYTNGAKSVDPDIQVESVFLGSWEDTAKGKQAQVSNVRSGYRHRLPNRGGGWSWCPGKPWLSVTSMRSALTRTRTISNQGMWWPAI